MMRRAWLAISLLGLAACTSEPALEPAWSPVFDELDGTLLSAWGPSLDELWLVGGGLGAPGEALAVRHDGDRWTRIESGTDETFWWVWGSGPDDVFFVGTGGYIGHWDGASIQRMESPTTSVLFGVWGAGPNDVWAVGGDPLGAGERDLIVHYDGSTWSTVTLADPPGVALFKVWGAAADDVWAVGQRGVILHFDGRAWSASDSGVTTDLFTVTGASATDVWAVGGSPPTLLHNEGSGWSRMDNPGLAAQLNGIAVGQDGSVLVVGNNGVKWRREASGAWFDEFDQPPFLDLHAAWLAPDARDGLVVGGNFNAPAAAQRVGVAAYFGATPPSDVWAGP